MNLVLFDNSGHKRNATAISIVQGLHQERKKQRFGSSSMIFQAKVCGDFAWSSWLWIFPLDGLQGALTPNKVVLHCCRLDQGRRRRRSNWQKPEFGSPVQCSRHALKMTLQSITGQVSVRFFDIVCNSENTFQSTFFYAALSVLRPQESFWIWTCLRDYSRICNSVGSMVSCRAMVFSLATREQCVQCVQLQLWFSLATREQCGQCVQKVLNTVTKQVCSMLPILFPYQLQVQTKLSSNSKFPRLPNTCADLYKLICK